jgi:hypothetical protein
MAEFVMPPAHIGMPALWHEGGGDTNVYSANVIGVHAETVKLRVFGADNDFIKDCPRHKSDPRARDTEKHDEGLWDYTDMSREFYAKHKVTSTKG